MASDSSFCSLDEALGRLKITSDRVKAIPLDEQESKRKLWHRGSLNKSRNQKYLLEDKKVIESGDIPLGLIPVVLNPPLVLTTSQHRLIETWDFVNALYGELKQAQKHEVRKLKKLRCKIAGPLMLGLHLIVFIVARKFRAMSDEMSEQDFEESMRCGEAHDYAEAAGRARERFDVVINDAICSMSRTNRVPVVLEKRVYSTAYDWF